VGGLFLALSEMQSHYAPAILSQLAPCSPVPLSAQAERDAEMDGHHFCLFIFLALPKVALKSHQWTNLSLSQPRPETHVGVHCKYSIFPQTNGKGCLIDLLLAPAPFKIVEKNARGRKLQIKYLPRNRHQWPAPSAAASQLGRKVDATANLTIIFVVYFEPFRGSLNKNIHRK
jgi:hypothetical protein